MIENLKNWKYTYIYKWGININKNNTFKYVSIFFVSLDTFLW